jgi:pantoate--beta-alanine ligase
LFNLVNPTYAIFGEKDAQQAMIIKKMVKDLNMRVKIITVPTVREKDGLAVSSRNKYLSPLARREAGVLYEALKYGEKLIKEGERESQKVIKKMKNLIETKRLAKIEYVEIVEKKTLTPVKKIQNEILLAVCVWFEKARLIDNLSVKVG